ncbi:MAG: diguanylate cyclase [Helicobacteraceae bacterium]|nr:diguanylate cyclase [Helicobacteraceae bacterium]
MILLKQRFKNYPIQTKITYSNLFVLIFAFLPLIIIMVLYEYFALQSALIKENRILSEVVSQSVAAPMAFRDELATNDTLLALKGIKDLLEVHLVFENGEVFKNYYRYAEDKTNETKMYKILKYDNEEVFLDTIKIEKSIFLRSEYQGSVVLVLSLDSFYNRLAWYIFIILATASFAFLIAIFVTKYISKSITEPLSKLTEATQKMIHNQDYKMDISGIKNSTDEVGTLSSAFVTMLSQIHERDLSLQQLAYYDRVTSIANRHYFEEKIVQTVENARRYGTSCYLLMIDLDDFKIVNDTIGHHVGDLLLRFVGQSIQAVMRQNDSVFRIGGDEFAILIESKSPQEAVDKIAKKIIEAISMPITLDGHQVQIGASIGISCFPKLSHDVQSLMSTADAAMYIAKRKGKNSYERYSE